MATRILLAEDDSDDKDLFLTFFRDRDDIVVLPVAANGVELTQYLNKVESDADLPDLIVLDQNMPLMNGKETLKYLVSHPRFSGIPAVVYSTYADTNLVVECKQSGARMVASKPMDAAGYQKMMDDFLKIV